MVKRKIQSALWVGAGSVGRGSRLGGGWGPTRARSTAPTPARAAKAKANPPGQVFAKGSNPGNVSWLRNNYKLFEPRRELRGRGALRKNLSQAICDPD